MVSSIDRGEENNEFDVLADEAQAVYLVHDDPDGLFDQATAAGATVVRRPRDEEYGSRGFAVRDVEGNFWSVGTFRGEIPDPLSTDIGGGPSLAGAAPKMAEVSETTTARLDEALQVLRRVFGYDSFRGEQAEIIEHVVGGRRRAGADADRRRQVAVLPDPGAGPSRHRRRDLAADRADAGPGGRAHGARRAGRIPQLDAGLRRAARGRAGVPGRRARPALPGPRAAAGRGDRCGCSTGARSRCSRSTRRTASPSGATTSGPTTCCCPSCTSAGPTCRGSR